MSPGVLGSITLPSVGLLTFDIHPAMWAIKSWLVTFSELQDSYLACRTKCYRQYSDVAFVPTFLVQVEWSSTNTALSQAIM